MNYLAIYDSLVMRRIEEPSKGYVERHHIVPRCMGGSDDKENLVKFSAREHLIAHLLLAKIHGGQLIVAAFLMTNMKKYGSRKYQWLKEEHSSLQRSKTLTDEHKALISASTKARMTPELRARLSKLSRASQLGKKKKPHSAETKAKMSAAAKKCIRLPHTPETKAKISAGNMGRKLEPKECPHCKKLVDPPNFGRYHGDRCKLNN